MGTINAELQARFDSRASFYGKAIVTIDHDGEQKLYSYNTHVATITADNTATVRNVQSATTLRHVKEFLLQNGFRADNKAQIIADYGTEDVISC